MPRQQVWTLWLFECPIMKLLVLSLFNFSRIDNAQVEVVQKANTANTTNMHMFAVNYNVLRIQSGMGGLAFSN